MKCACPDCGQHIEFPEEMAEAEVNCPSCARLMCLDTPHQESPSEPPESVMTNRIPSPTRGIVMLRWVAVPCISLALHFGAVWMGRWFFSLVGLASAGWAIAYVFVRSFAVVTFASLAAPRHRPFVAVICCLLNVAVWQFLALKHHDAAASGPPLRDYVRSLLPYLLAELAGGGSSVMLLTVWQCRRQLGKPGEEPRVDVDESSQVSDEGAHGSPARLPKILAYLSLLLFVVSLAAPAVYADAGFMTRSYQDLPGIACLFAGLMSAGLMFSERTNAADLGFSIGAFLLFLCNFVYIAGLWRSLRP